MFIERFGNDWEAARKCNQGDGSFDNAPVWNEADLWQEKLWIKDGL
jgi:hypothetical protein